MVSFLKDVNKNFGKDGLDGNLSSFENTDWFKAWGIVFRARCTGVNNCNENTKADWAVLNMVREMRLNSTVMTAIGNDAGLVEVIKLNSRAGCNVCGTSPAPHLNKMDQYLKDVIYFANTFEPRVVGGVADVLGKKGIKNDSRHQIEATAFILRVINEKHLTRNQVSAFEEKQESINDDGETNTVFADIVIYTDPVYTSYFGFVECKSWAPEGIAFQKFIKGEGNAYKQFKTYLGLPAVTFIGGSGYMNKLQYWFDKGKASEEVVKKKFQEMLKNKKLATEIFDVKPSLFIQHGIPTSTALNQLAISNELFNHQVLGFILIK